MKWPVKRKYRSQKGQAITEMVAGLLVLAVVMIGGLVVALLGMQSIRNTVRARSLADEYSLKGNRKGTAHFLINWGQNRSVTLGGKGQVRGRLADPGAFTEELTDNNGFFHTRYLGTKAAYAENSFVYVESDLFISAADLTISTAVQNDVLQEYRHFDAASILKALRLPSNFKLEEKICMPVNVR